jgi:hypothetical protein
VDALFRFMVDYEGYVYLIIGIGALFSARSLWKAFSEWRKAVFGLEKELSFQKVRGSGALFILLIMIGLSQFCMVSFIVPYLPATTFWPTPTANLLQTPTGTQTTPGAEQSLILIEPNDQASATGCVPGEITFSSPQPGDEVQGKVTLTGTVSVQSFGFYKYEYAPQGSDTWATIAAGDKIVVDNELGRWDTSQLVPGDYQLRLLVTNNLGEALPACILPVRVIAP